MGHNSLGKAHHHKTKDLISSKKARVIVDKAVYFITALGIIMTIPQAVLIWGQQNASGVSLISWSTYLFMAFFWLIYGLVHKIKSIIFSNIAWIILEIFIIIGIVRYG